MEHHHLLRFAKGLFEKSELLLNKHFRGQEKSTAAAKRPKSSKHTTQNGVIFHAGIKSVMNINEGKKVFKSKSLFSG